MTAAVTPGRHDTGPTVLDEHRQSCTRGSAAVGGGDVCGTDQIPVPLELAMGTREAAAFGFRNLPSADWAGGGAAALVHHPHDHAGPLGLVPEGMHKVGASPLPQAEVLHPAHVLACDVLGVADQQGTDSLSHRKGNHLLGGLMLSLVDAPAMTRLLTPHAEPVTAPAPRPPLAWLGCPPRSPRVAGLLVAQGQGGLGANRPARD